jgi:cytochrome c
MNLRDIAVAAGAAAIWAGSAHAAVDEAAAQALMRKSGCLKCHSVTAKKDGPSFKSTAERLKGKPDAHAELYKHLTTHPMVKVEGKEERHAALKTTNDAEINNVIEYILSR